MTSNQMQVPAIDYSLGGSGASPYLGGMIAGWSAEGAGFPQTSAVLRQIELKANILSGYTVASRTLLADNQVGLQMVLTELFGETIGYYMDYAIFRGSGVNQPQGIVGAATTLQQNRASAGNGATLADLAAMKGKQLPESVGRSIFMVSPSTYGTFIVMTDASGRVVWLPVMAGPDQGSASVKPKMLVLGEEMVSSQLPASAGSSTDVALIDPDAYALGMRQDIEIGVSEHVNFLSNQLTWRFITRADGQPRINAPLTLQNGDQVSPFLIRN